MNARWSTGLAGAAIVAVLSATVLSATVLSLGGDGAPASVAAQPQPSTTTSPRGTITVSGHGTVTAEPDTASVSLGVSVTESRATDALGRASERAAALIATLRGLGVAERDITTTGVTLAPQYQYDRDLPRILGYQASNDLTVTIRDLATAGRVIDAAVGSAGDAARVGGVSFSVGDTAAVVGAARGAAIADATRRAGDYASTGHVQVGTIVEISEGRVATPWPVTYAADSAAPPTGGPVPLQPGTQELAVDVTVVFQIA